MKNTNYWKTIILALSIISFISCSNLFNNVETNNQNKAYLVINSVELNNSRSINPPSDEEILNSFTSISLSGSGKDSSNKTLSLSNINAENLKELYKKQILLDEGSWTFTLTAKLGSIDFTSIAKGSDGNTSISIESGKANSISFNLEPKDTAKGYGGLSVKINFDKKNVSKVKISLYKTDNDDDDTNDEVKDSKEVTSFSWDSKDQNYYVSYSRAITNTSSKIEAGEYRLVFDFYNDNTCLDSIPYIVHIAEGVTTTYQQTVDINEVFTITYKGIDVSPTAYIAAGQTKVTKYSRKSEDIILPRYNRQDRLFEGWYDSEGNPVTVIPHNTNKNITVTARWRDLEENSTETLYINPSAQYHLGTSEQYGYESLEAALETIERVHSYVNKHSWIIKIKGSISGSHAIESNSNNFNNYVQSITLEGSTGPDADGIPQDELKGGFTTATENGAVLAVNTKVPVTIKNLKITGGNNSNTGDIKGGGIFVNSNAKVTLDDGALITGNSAPSGSGIYIASNGSVNGTFQMGGEAQVTSDNNVYLPSGAKLLITKSFEGNITHGATIIPETYEEDLQVLALASGASGALDVEYSIFKIAPQVSGGVTTKWFISAEGKLYPDETGNIYVGSNDNPGNANGSKNNPFTTLADALAKIEADGDSETEFTIFIDGAVSSDTGTTIDIDSTKASKLTITGKTGTSTDSISGALKCTPIIIDTAIPVSISNLTITGGSGENGGGIIVNSGSLTIEDGTLITGNTSSDNGAGIYVKEEASLYLTGGTIQNNTLTGSSSYGAGIYCEDGEYVYLSGAPVVNDIYIASTTPIKLVEDLSSGASITVTPYYYEIPHTESGISYTQIACYEDDYDTPIGDNSEYFHITPDQDNLTIEWYVDERGWLNTKRSISFAGEGTTGMSASVGALCPVWNDDAQFQIADRDGYEFAGWYYIHEINRYNGTGWDPTRYEIKPFEFKESEDDSEYTDIESDITLYATWRYLGSSTIYVNGDTGADGAYIDYSDNTKFYLGDGSASKPLRSVGAALEVIKLINDSTEDYTITISGKTDDYNLTIDNNLPIKSLLLQGKTSAETDGINCDGYDLPEFVSVLKVSTSVPVTIRNMLVQGRLGEYEVDGAIMNIGNGSTVTLENGTVFDAAYSSIVTKGAVAIEDGGTLIMEDGVTFHNFDVKGGAVNVKTGGTFIMNGGTFEDNSSDGTCGAVYVNGGTFTMNNGYIKNNWQDAFQRTYLLPQGAGVCVASGTFIMEGGHITNNESYVSNVNSNYTTAGGGVFVYANGTFIMHGGEITGNHAYNKAKYSNGTTSDDSTAQSYGGGVCLQASGDKIASFTMTGGTISGNTAGTSGNGIGFIGTPSDETTGVITIGGTAVISSSNDIYLPDFMTIAVASELTGSDSLPTITPANYERTTPVLTLAQDAAETLVSEFSKFKVTANGSTTYTISELGKLVASTNGGNGGSSIPDDFVQVTGASITSAPIIVLDDDDHTQNTEGAFSAATTTNPITVSSFYMCEHEVTQAEYELYCIYGDTAPSETSNKDQYPVYNISWYDAIVYCNLRSLAENLTPVYSIKKSGDTTEKSTKPAEWVGIRTSGSKYCGPDSNNSSWDWVAASPGYDSIEINSDANGYRLPTVAEWEYAARGGNGLTGTQTKYSGSSDVTKVSFDDYSIHKIMQKDPNTLQIYDMTGSVSEWIWDVAGEDYRAVSPLNGYIDNPSSAYPYERNHGNDNYIGFRIVRNAE